MAEARTSERDRRRRRRWSFADCVFDEANWTLLVGGRRVAVEAKPLELLRELLLQAGNLVPKESLLDAIWPDVVVVEASLPTAVRKLRLALNDDQRPAPIVETVPRLGYRLTAPVTVEEPSGAANDALTAAPLPAQARGRRKFGHLGTIALFGGLTVIIGATAIALTSSKEVPAVKAAASFSGWEIENAIRRLDVGAIERMIAAGWNPDLPIFPEGSAALHHAVEMCEWNPNHDRNRLLLMVRTLYEGGGRLDRRNAFGDTPYSIAKAPRYCGPDHPVTRSLRATCSQNGVVLDRYLASYEVARRQRR